MACLLPAFSHVSVVVFVFSAIFIHRGAGGHCFFILLLEALNERSSPPRGPRGLCNTPLICTPHLRELVTGR
jgi:hypothetical protein